MRALSPLSLSLSFSPPSQFFGGGGQWLASRCGAQPFQLTSGLNGCVLLGSHSIVDPILTSEKRQRRVQLPDRMEAPVRDRFVQSDLVAIEGAAGRPWSQGGLLAEV